MVFSVCHTTLKSVEVCYLAGRWC